MLRDNLVGLIEPMRNSAGFDPLALGIQKQASDDRPSCLENPRPAGAESSLTENAASPFQAEPAHSRDLIGYEPKQIILLHANQLEADHIAELFDLLRKRGYRFITLEDALSDQAYGMPDTYVGEDGAGWLERWAITRGRPPIGAPVFPPAILERSRALPPPPGETPSDGSANP